MYIKKHTGQNIKTTNFTKEVIRRAAISMNTSEIKLVAMVIESEFSRIVEALNKETK